MWVAARHLFACPTVRCTLSTTGRDNPQINMTFLQAQTCVHMGLCSELQASPVELSRPSPCLPQPVEINSPTGRSSKNKSNNKLWGGTWTLATRTLDSYGHGPKSQTFVQHLRLPQWGRSKRTGCPSHPTPNPTQTQPGHKFNYSKSSPNAASKQAKSH